MCVYLVRFDGTGELWGEKQVFLVSRVIDVDYHPSLGVRLIEDIVHMRPAAFFRAGGDRAVFIIVFLAAYPYVFIPGAQLNHI